jgi:hypothetical protein
MKKFAADVVLSDQEWSDLSALSLIDRTKLIFEPKNCRWAESAEEMQDNEQFYRSLPRQLVS